MQPDRARPRLSPLRVAGGYITALEEACDAYNENLPTLRSFVLPGGSAGSALLHTARTVVRRAERTTWAAIAEHEQTMNPLTAQYLNRLSDLLFILARCVTGPDGDLLWKPGSDR